MHRFNSFGVLLCVAAACGGAGATATPPPGGKVTRCTLMGCTSGLLIDLTQRGQPIALDPGAVYHVTLELDGTQLACSDAGASTEPGVCVPRMRCDDAIELVELDCGERFQTINVGAQPAEVAVRITRDGQAIVDTKRHVDYLTRYPNGKACDGEDGGCRQGGFSLDVP